MVDKNVLSQSNSDVLSEQPLIATFKAGSFYIVELDIIET